MTLVALEKQPPVVNDGGADDAGEVVEASAFGLVVVAGELDEAAVGDSVGWASSLGRLVRKSLLASP